MNSQLRCWIVVAACVVPLGGRAQAVGAALEAGRGQVDITDETAGPVRGRLHARALAVRGGGQTLVVVSIDAVAIGEIGRIGNDFLPQVREELRQRLGIHPDQVMVNASHCHGIVCDDVAERTVRAVELAWKRLTPVTVGAGWGEETRIMENRRLKLKSGREADVRHAYSLPPDEEIAEVGPVDPQIGLLRLDRAEGAGTVAVVYNFACHPIQGVPGGANTADITGFSSEVIEESLGGDAVALFVQGCGGDINPVFYKDVDHPRDAEVLGNMLGLAALRGIRTIQCRPDARLQVLHRRLELPRSDLAPRIAALEAEQQRLLTSLRGTSLNLKTFLPLAVKHSLSAEYPSYYSHRYLHDEQMGREDLKALDAENRRNLAQYVRNIHVMEELTRLNTNLALLRKHQASLVDSGKRTITAEVLGIRVGPLAMITFPGELTVRIGLNIKGRSPIGHTLVAGYTNGYLYYSPTAEQLRNVGGAQEDSDCLLAPQWQAIFEREAAELLKSLE